MINVSNHPSSRWSDEQREEAKNWGGGPLVDIPFPAVPPTATSDEVRAMSTDLVEKIKAVGDSAVHIMGEAGLTYAVVSRLKKLGYDVVHSTTERQVVEKVREDGTVEKTAVFKFVQFRPY